MMNATEKKDKKNTVKESLVEKAARKLATNSSGTDNSFSGNIQNKSKTSNSDITEPVMSNSNYNFTINEDRLKEQNILTLNNDNVLIAEEFRLIKRSLLINAFTGGESAIENGNIIMVTSSLPNEGKTYCAMSLALSMAKEKDLNVLLVDADVSKPDVMKTFGEKNHKGLIDVIGDDSVDLRDCIVKTDLKNLSILPAGKKHSFTTELLASEKMGNIIDELAQRYHDRVIVIDSPPALASSASSVLAMHVGQILFVVEAERTSEQEVKEALQLVKNCENINLILNKAKFHTGSKRFGSYYGYGYD